MSLSSAMTAKAQELSNLEHGKLSATVEAIEFLILAQRKGDSLSPVIKQKIVRVCTIAQLCLTPYNPDDCSPPGSSVHGIIQARKLEWAAMPSSRKSSRSRDQTRGSYLSCVGR